MNRTFRLSFRPQQRHHFAERHDPTILVLSGRGGSRQHSPDHLGKALCVGQATHHDSRESLGRVQSHVSAAGNDSCEIETLILHFLSKTVFVTLGRDDDRGAAPHQSGANELR